MMCGSLGASRCTAEKWFEYMGDATGNPYVPFQITYRGTDTPVGNFTPADLPCLPCSASVKVITKYTIFFHSLNKIINGHTFTE